MLYITLIIFVILIIIGVIWLINYTLRGRTISRINKSAELYKTNNMENKQYLPADQEYFGGYKILILFDHDVGVNDADQHYSKPFRHFAKIDPSITFLELGVDKQYKKGESILKIIQELYGDSQPEPVVFHCVIWRGLVVKDLDKYTGRKIVDLEDQYNISYIFPYLPYFDSVTCRYFNTQQLEVLKRQFPNHKCFYLPHALDPNNFQDWQLEKQYDIIFISARNNMHAYPMRQRLYNLFGNNANYKTKYLNDSRKCSQAEYSKELNKSWLCVTTPTWGNNTVNNDYYLRKFMEIPMSKSVVLGYVPVSGIEDYGDNYVKATEDMTDETIVKTVDSALQNKNVLNQMANNLYEHFRSKYSYAASYKLFINICNE